MTCSRDRRQPRDDLTLKYSTDFKFDYDQTAVRATRRWDIQPINVAAVNVWPASSTSSSCHR